MKARVLTGDRPSGKLHLGHYIGSLQNRIKLQSQYDQYVMIADVQALTDNFDNPKKITDNVVEVAKDYISVGIDPSVTSIFIQSQIPALTELTIYFLNLVTVARLERNPTIKTEIKQKGLEESLPVGFLCYPVSQAADITLFKASLVPVGEDQLPLLEQTNEIVRKFNTIYKTDLLKECTPILSSYPRLIGIDGQAKASKSLNNTIFLSDEPSVIQEKVFQMFTDPQHLKVSDPGKVEGNVVFSYLDAFFQDPQELAALKAHYQKGGLGDMTLKKLLNTCLQELLAPIREKRNNIKEQEVLDILHDGTLNANQIAKETIEEVRAAIGLSYKNASYSRSSLNP